MKSKNQTGFILFQQQGPGGYKQFPLDKNVITIGRDAGNDIIIEDSDVSRRHAMLTRQGDTWVLEDLNSTYGVYVNGYRVTAPVYLNPGDQVSLAPDVFLGMQAAAAGSGASQPARRGAKKKRPRWVVPVVLGAIGLMAVVVLAAGLIGGYFYLQSQPGASEAELPDVFSLDVSIQEPAPDTHMEVGESILVRASARDESGVTRIELWINDVLVLQQDSPQEGGINPLMLEHGILATDTGDYHLIARAFNGDGLAKDSMAVTVVVEEGQLDVAKEIPSSQYIAQEGDTIKNVANKVGIPANNIQNANPGMPNKLPAGQVVMIPAMPPGMARLAPGIVKGGFVAIGNPGQPAAVPGVQMGGPQAGQPAAQPGGQQGAQPVGPQVGVQGGQQGGQPAAQPGGQQGAQPVGPQAGQQGGQPGVQGGLQNLPSLDNPFQIDPNLMPDPMTVFDPPKAKLIAPVLKWVIAQDCNVDLSWTIDPKSNFAQLVLERSSVPASPSGIMKVLISNNQKGYKDTVPVPGVYLYTLYGCTISGNTVDCVPSNISKATVSLTDKCTDTAKGFKYVYFQPLHYNSLGAKGDLALWYSIGGSFERRLPSGQADYRSGGDWTFIGTEAVPSPSSVYLKPNEELKVKLRGAAYTYKGAFSGKGITDLGIAVGSHLLDEIKKKTQRFWRAENPDMRVDYRIWIEDVKWTGKGTTNKIPAPSKLRVKTTAAAERVLTWDWPYDGKVNIDGFILYRNYLCPTEKLKTSAPMFIKAPDKEVAVSLRNEPVNCTYQYMVSAYGRAGESDPSNMLTDQTIGKIHRIQITVEDLTIIDLGGASRGVIHLSSNNHYRNSEILFLEENRKYDLDHVQFNDKFLNNSWAQDVADTEYGQIKISVSSIGPDGYRLQGGVCSGGLALPKVSDWPTREKTYNYASRGGVCKATIHVKYLGEFPSDAKFIPDQAVQPPPSQGQKAPDPQKPAPDPAQASGQQQGSQQQGSQQQGNQQQGGQQAANQQPSQPQPAKPPDPPAPGKKLPRNPDSYYFQAQNKDDATAGAFYDLSGSNADITHKIYAILDAMKLFTQEMNVMELNIQTQKGTGFYVEGCTAKAELPNWPKNDFQVDCFKAQVAVGMDSDLEYFTIASEQIKDPVMKRYVQQFLLLCRNYVAHYLIMDGASNDNYNEGMKIVKERETMLQDIFDIYNNNIRTYALKNPN